MGVNMAYKCVPRIMGVFFGVSGLFLGFYSIRSSLLSRRSDVGFTAVYLHKTIESVF
jgi:hypothetical protein